MAGVWKGSPPRSLVILSQVIPRESHAADIKASVLTGPASVEHCIPIDAHFDWHVSLAATYAKVGPPAVVVIVVDAVDVVVDGGPVVIVAVVDVVVDGGPVVVIDAVVEVVGDVVLGRGPVVVVDAGDVEVDVEVAVAVVDVVTDEMKSFGPILLKSCSGPQSGEGQLLFGLFGMILVSARASGNWSLCNVQHS